ncbi:MAG TPA: hypothetical protein VN883_15035 [Myxococcales bacterium]|jgi:hypothetical protein|nr:hypothetical protein [Myxococcales bacterium]
MTDAQRIGRAARTVLLSLSLGTAAAVAFAFEAAPLAGPLAAAGGAFGSTDLAHASAALALLMVLQALTVAAACALAALAVDLSPLAGATAGVMASALPAGISAAAEGLDVLWPAPLVLVRVAGGFLAAGAGALACGLIRTTVTVRIREGRQSVLRRLREDSGLRLDREGQFWHRGGRVEHARTQLVLHRGLHRAGDGRWATRIGREWGYVEVEDAARFARRLEEDSQRPGRLRAQLWGGEWVEVDPASLAAGEGDALYVRVPPGGERARLTRAAQLSLADRLREEGGAFWLELSGRRVPIGSDGGPEPFRMFRGTGG